MSTTAAPAELLFGLVAEFDTPGELLGATRRAYSEGYRELEAYSPYPIHGLAEATGHKREYLPWIVLAGGIAGALGGFGLQYWASVIAFPMVVGGRPFNSWPAFIPITFECMILLASFAAVFGMLALNGLPQPHHPLFNVPGFSKVTRDGYFLAIHRSDPMFDLEVTGRYLDTLEPMKVDIVEY